MNEEKSTTLTLPEQYAKILEKHGQFSQNLSEVNDAIERCQARWARPFPGQGGRRRAPSSAAPPSLLFAVDTEAVADARPSYKPRG